VGTPDSLKREVGGGTVTLTLEDAEKRDPALQALAPLDGAARLDPRSAGAILVLHVPDARTAVGGLVPRLDRAGITVEAVDQARASLADVFLHYTGEKPHVEARMEGATSAMFAAAHGRARRP